MGEISNSRPSVSVVIPAYNAAGFIREAVESVLLQTYPVSEIVIVDDGSTDDCLAALTGIAWPVKYIRIENSGPAKARNMGIAACSSELVAFLDADDMWLPDKIMSQVEMLVADPTLAMVYCGKLVVDGAGRDLGAYVQDEYPSGDVLLSFLRANHISTTSVVLVRREVLLDAGGFSEERHFRNCEDYELWMRIASRHRIGAVRKYLIKYRLHQSNATRNSAGRYVGMLAAVDSIAKYLAMKGLLTEEMERILNGRRESIHREFSLALLYEGHYALAKRAAREAYPSGGVLVDAKLILLALLPIWLIKAIHRLAKAPRIEEVNGK